MRIRLYFSHTLSSSINEASHGKGTLHHIYTLYIASLLFAGHCGLAVKNVSSPTCTAGTRDSWEQDTESRHLVCYTEKQEGPRKEEDALAAKVTPNAPA
mmetsp:Transcript_32346/g.80577  ORF Transcript_32346/g.80577 Transcript_32346/m.80577 type:complete len:99 (-) Transcript_32346:1590-1886(-)